MSKRTYALLQTIIHRNVSSQEVKVTVQAYSNHSRYYLLLMHLKLFESREWELLIVLEKYKALKVQTSIEVVMMLT